MPGKAVNFDFSKTAYEQEPDKYFIYEKEDDDMGGMDVFFFLEPADANGISDSSYQASERARYLIRTMKVPMLLRLTVSMNPIRSGLIGFRILRTSKGAREVAETSVRKKSEPIITALVLCFQFGRFLPFPHNQHGIHYRKWTRELVK